MQAMAVCRAPRHSFVASLPSVRLCLTQSAHIGEYRFQAIALDPRQFRRNESGALAWGPLALADAHCVRHSLTYWSVYRQLSGTPVATKLAVAAGSGLNESMRRDIDRQADHSATKE